MKNEKWDIFISHASEDKDTVARPLLEALRKAAVRVWLDAQELKVGDRLSSRIDQGLLASRFGALILSPAFFAKHWPKEELSALWAREEEGQKVILPIWHNVDKTAVRQFSPRLADRLAVTTAQGIRHVADSLLAVIFGESSDSPSVLHPSLVRRLIQLIESQPSKKEFVEFLRFHIVRARYLGFGGPLALKPYWFDGVKFDAYIAYVGHSVRLKLFRFTEVWDDPFKARPAASRPQICSDLQSAILQVREIQSRFRSNAAAQKKLNNKLLSEYADDSMASFWKRYPPKPTLEFVVFAGRRSSIDATVTRHNSWSIFLKKNRAITIKSYDYIIDAFRLDNDDFYSKPR